MIYDMVIDENNIAFIPSIGISFEISESAKEIIRLIKEGKDQIEISKILAHEYNRSWKEIFIDVEDFFLKLKIYGIIQ